LFLADANLNPDFQKRIGITELSKQRPRVIVSNDEITDHI